MKCKIIDFIQSAYSQTPYSSSSFEALLKCAIYNIYYIYVFKLGIYVNHVLMLIFSKILQEWDVLFLWILFNF